MLNKWETLPNFAIWKLKNNKDWCVGITNI